MGKETKADDTTDANHKISRPSEEPSRKKQSTLRADVLPAALGASTAAKRPSGETEQALRRATEKKGS
jgi:hypothetical protein